MQVFLAFLAYAGFNLFLNFFNKWALSTSGAGFSYPVFYSMWHMIASIIGSWVLMKVKPPPTGMPSIEQFLTYKWEALSLAICTSINISCNNASLMLIGLFVNQVVKALAPLISMVCSFLLLKRRYEWKIIVIVLLIAGSACAAVPFKDPAFSYLGLFLVCIATLASATKPVVGEMLMTATEKPKLSPAALVFYDSCFSFVFMLFFWLVVPSEREGSIEYVGEKPGLAWGIILAGSTAAFCYNMSVFYFTLVASALAVMVATNLLKVILITTSAVIDNIRDPLNWCGIVVFFGAVVAYAYMSFKGRQKKPAETKPAETKPDEKSSLVSK